jgi:hypothetical protein
LGKPLILVVSPLAIEANKVAQSVSSLEVDPINTTD